MIHLGSDGRSSWLSSKESTCRAGAAGDVGSIPGSGRSPREGHSNPPQYSCQENPIDKRAWQAIVHRIEKSRTRLKQLSTHTRMHNSGSPCSQGQEVTTKVDWSDLMGFSRQECWSGLPFSFPGDLPDPESNPGLPHCRQILYHLSHQESPHCLTEANISMSQERLPLLSPELTERFDLKVFKNIRQWPKLKCVQDQRLERQGPRKAISGISGPRSQEHWDHTVAQSMARGLCRPLVPPQLHRLGQMWGKTKRKKHHGRWTATWETRGHRRLRGRWPRWWTKRRGWRCWKGKDAGCTLVDMCPRHLTLP